MPHKMSFVLFILSFLEQGKNNRKKSLKLILFEFCIVIQGKHVEWNIFFSLRC